MIHHFARALAVREQVRTQAPATQRSPASGANPASSAAVTPLQPRANRLRIHRDPSDARRTVIAGRFADVCAALDRMAAELEAAA
ncbi:MAG: hypothetical protein ACOZE7_15570 [Pseudomonadota bacterium]